MILWGRNNSSNVQKVAWALNEMGIEYERKDVGGAFGIVNTPAYMAMNPNSRVPTLEDNGFVLWESNAILRYLGEKYGQFIPANLHERAKMNQWLDWQQTTLIPPLTPVFWGLVRTKPEERNLAVIEENAIKTIEVVQILDEQLKNTRYIAGEELSLADFANAIMVYRALTLIPNRKPLPHVERWYGEIAKRQHFIGHVTGLGLT